MDDPIFIEELHKICEGYNIPSNLDKNTRKALDPFIRYNAQLVQLLNHKLTLAYPHKCFNAECKRFLTFWDVFMHASEQGISLTQFTKLWKENKGIGNPKFKNIVLRIPFYCCNCFNFRNEELHNFFDKR